MKKYYYDCPIKAAYMAEKFGVKFGIKYGRKLVWDWCDVTRIPRPARTATDILEDYPDQSFGDLYVHPESMHIFEPQAEDSMLLSISNGIEFSPPLVVGTFCMHTGYPDSPSQYVKEQFGEAWEIKDWRIILRKNRSFIWPKEEV